jgi:F-type H+-transporting ATPase subunit gamma
MRREIALKERLRSLQALREAVSAMKNLSAHQLRDARSAVEPARVYREGIVRLGGFENALAPGSNGAGLLVIGAELGLCGSYNHQIVEAGAAHREAHGKGPTFCVGRRASMLLARRGVVLTQTYGATTSVHGITPLLLRLAEDVLTCFATESLSTFDIVSSRFAGVGAVHATSVRFLPFEVESRTTAKPLRYVSREAFASSATRELLYATLYGLLLDALATEHGARLVATQAAEEWLDERASQLRRHLTATRRELSTQEVLEIAVGARAVRR